MEFNMNDANEAAEARRCDGIAGDDLLARAIAGEEFLLFDGAMGTMLQRAGLAAGDLPDLLCLTQPEAVTAIHRAYVEAGSQVVTTNTFGANRMKLGDAASVENVYAAAVENGRRAGALYVAADIGPTGELLDPLGDLTFEEAYELFAEEARAAAGAGADLVIIETMADLQEAEAAVRAVKDSCDLPVFATMTFGMGGRTFLGVAPDDAARALDGLGVDALGVNCSLGPAEIAPIVDALLAATDKPVIVQANAGLPVVVDGVTTYAVDALAYAQHVAPLIEAGASIIGGCCGTDPGYIRELAKLLEGRRPAARASATG